MCHDPFICRWIREAAVKALEIIAVEADPASIETVTAILQV